MLVWAWFSFHLPLYAPVILHLFLYYFKKCISKTQQIPLGLYFSLYITYSLFPDSMILSWTMNEPSLQLRCFSFVVVIIFKMTIVKW